MAIFPKCKRIARVIGQKVRAGKGRWSPCRIFSRKSGFGRLGGEDGQGRGFQLASIAGKSNEFLPLRRQTHKTPPKSKKKAELSLGQVQQGGMRCEKKLNRVSRPI
jgi:hypothetical protein